MTSTALYQALIEVGASQENANRAAEDVVQMSELAHLATKSDIAKLESNTKADIAALETRLIKWAVSCAFLFAGIVIAGVCIVMQVMLSPGVAQ